MIIVKKPFAVFLSIIFILFLSGCGQKGVLYLKEEPTASSESVIPINTVPAKEEEPQSSSKTPQ